MVDIQSATAENRRRKKETTATVMSASVMQGGNKKESYFAARDLQIRRKYDGAGALLLSYFLFPEEPEKLLSRMLRY